MWEGVVPCSVLATATHNAPRLLAATASSGSHGNKLQEILADSSWQWISKGQRCCRHRWEIVIIVHWQSHSESLSQEVQWWRMAGQNRELILTMEINLVLQLTVITGEWDITQPKMIPLLLALCQRKSLAITTSCHFLRSLVWSTCSRKDACRQKHLDQGTPDRNKLGAMTPSSD